MPFKTFSRSTFCPAAFDVTPMKKWRWPDSQYSSSTYCRPCARLHWTSHRRRNDVDPTFSLPAQDPLRPIIYPHATSFRQRNDVGRTSVGPYVLDTCLKSFLATFHKMITTTCIACFRPMPLRILNKLHRTALECPFLGSFIITVVTIFVIIFHESAFTVTIT